MRTSRLCFSSKVFSFTECLGLAWERFAFNLPVSITKPQPNDNYDDGNE